MEDEQVYVKVNVLKSKSKHFYAPGREEERELKVEGKDLDRVEAKLKKCFETINKIKKTQFFFKQHN
jgi:hypothetical protein